MAAPTDPHDLMPAWQPGDMVEIPIERIVDYPLLAETMTVWRAAAADGLPATIDPVALPRAVVKGINLFDVDPATGDVRVRLAGSLITGFIGRELRGERTSDIYVGSDLAAVRRSTHDALAARQPSLARRHVLDSRGRRWIYVRLLLPLSSDGIHADRLATVIDPGSFGQVGPGGLPNPDDRR